MSRGKTTTSSMSRLALMGFTEEEEQQILAVGIPLEGYRPGATMIIADLICRYSMERRMERLYDFLEIQADA